MNLRTTLKQIAYQNHITLDTKKIYSLNKFINNLHLEVPKAFDFKAMVDKIKRTYRDKSYKSEVFFIKNIAHAFNKNKEELLFNFQNHDLAQNFTTQITKQSLYNYKLILDNRHSSQNEIIQAQNNLETYIHKKNTQFIEQLDTKYSFKKLAKVKYIDYKNKDKTPVMLTFTLDKTYRKYIKDGESTLGNFEGLKEINKQANLELLIEKSYHKLNITFRNFYSYLKTLNRRSNEKGKLDYIMIFEPHKSLTLHLHILFYCNETQLNNLHRAWNNYLKDLDTKQKKAQDFKIIDITRANASTYLSKYLIKEYNIDSNGASFFNQFKRYFSKLKLFRTSNFYHTTQAKIDKMYTFLTANYPDILEQIRYSDIPIYEVLEQFEVQELFRFQYEKVESITFDRKRIQNFYDAYKQIHDDCQIKQEIIDNIDFFTQVIQISKIKEAVFCFNYDTISKIFEKYHIEVYLENETAEIDVFYTSDMYEMTSFDLNQSITQAEAIREYKILNNL